MLQVGDQIPAFTLRDKERNEVTQADFAGQPGVLAFYVLAFTGG